MTEEEINSMSQKYERFLYTTYLKFPEDMVGTKSNAYFKRFAEVESGKPLYQGNDSFPAMRQNIRKNIFDAIKYKISKCGDERKEKLLKIILSRIDSVNTSVSFIGMIDDCNQVEKEFE
jgi:hypothetical protein